MKKLIDQLKQARKAKHISQSAFGKKIGLPQSHISAIEAGHVDPRLSNVIEMARVLDMEPVLIPYECLSAVLALLHGESRNSPLWTIDPELDEEP